MKKFFSKLRSKICDKTVLKRMVPVAVSEGGLTVVSTLLIFTV